MGVEVEVVLYMKEPPDEKLLTRITKGLEDPVEDLVRKDSKFKKMELKADDYVKNSKAVVEILSNQKALLQRPLVVKGKIDGDGPLEAIIGRPKDRIANFISSQKNLVNFLFLGGIKFHMVNDVSKQIYRCIIRNR